METPNPLEPKLEEFNTACERIDYAMKRIAEKGWIQARIRPWRTANLDALEHHYDGPACLLGSLVTDTELANLEKAQKTDAIYHLTLPGLQEAALALQFNSAHAVWQWNDKRDRSVDEVLTRLQEGKGRACV